MSGRHTEACDIVCICGLVDKTGLNERGIETLAALLKILPPFHKGRWGKVFVPLMSKVVPTAIELVIVQNGKVLLTHRTDEFFTGWHTPGTYVGPRETRPEIEKELRKKTEIRHRPLVISPDGRVISIGD
jgi:hypothetical protein